MAYTELAIDALRGIPRIVKGKTNFLYVGTSDWGAEMQKEHPGKVFRTLTDAIAAVPAGDGTDTFGFVQTVIVMRGYETVTAATAPVTVPLTKSGVLITAAQPGQGGLTTSVALGADTPLLRIQGYNCWIDGLRFYADTVTQTGDCVQFGAAAGAGVNYCGMSNCLIQGSMSGTYKDFTRAVVTYNGKYMTYKNNWIEIGDGSTAGFKFAADAAGNGRSQYLKDNIVYCKDEASNACILVDVDVDQEGGIIDGGLYSNEGSTADVFEIDAANWTITGHGLACNADAVGAGAQIDWNGADRTVGPFYVKQGGGATAPTLFDESNV